MAAYAALLSLNFTIDRTPRSVIPDIYPPVDSLKEKITFLLKFFEDYDNHISREETEFERSVVDNAYAIETDIEWHAMNQMLIESGRSTVGSSTRLIPEDTIQLVIQEFEAIKKYAMQIMMNSTRVIEHSQRPASLTPGGVAPCSEKTMVGFQEHLIAVLGVMASKECSLQILPIVGMGGIGKTTLTRNVFDSQLIKDDFPVRLWFTVSQSNQVRNVVLGFLHDLGIVVDVNQECDSELLLRLYQYLCGRQFLIVMGDVWSVEIFDVIRRFFPDNGNGSRVIITTRIQEVASHCGSGDPQITHRLELLNVSESWNLLKQKVFAEDHDCPALLEEIGMEIAQRCDGLPLAIVVIAGQLAKSDMTKESWQNVARSLNTTVNSANDNQCQNILSLSYESLPVHLKPCFLYMATFPENFRFKVSRLVKSWVAEGFLKPVTDKCLEDIAMEYLKDLVERNLITVEARGAVKEMKHCHIHDLLRDLCLRKAHERNFLWCRTMRRFRLPTVESLIHELRSMKDGRDYPLVLSSMRVKVTDFSTFEILNSSSVENLWLFRYRRIHWLADRVVDFSTCSSSLVSLSILRNIQTLIMTEMPGIEPVVLPPQIWDMPELRHVEIQRVILPNPPIFEDNVGYHLLENMQTLLNLYNFKFSEEVIRRIPNLKKLKITYTKDPESRELSFYCLDNIAQLRKLETLSCSMYQAISATHISFPQSLKKLSLDGGNIPWEDMTVIGSLPNLQVLRLENDAFCGKVWTPIEGEFCNLKVLHLRNMSLEHWEADKVHFPKLESLDFYNVWRLKGIPCDIGDITTLKSISLALCSFSLFNSASELLEEQKEMENYIELAPLKEIMEQMPFFLSALLPDDQPRRGMPSKLEQLEYDLRQLNAFLSYMAAKKERNDEQLVNHIRDIMHEADNICKDLRVQIHKGNLSFDTWRRFLSIVKEIEHISIRVQRILLTVADGDLDQNTDRMLDKEPLDLLNITKDVRAVSSSGTQHVFRDFSRLTVADGRENDDEDFLAADRAQSILHLQALVQEFEALGRPGMENFNHSPDDEGENDPNVKYYVVAYL